MCACECANVCVYLHVYHANLELIPGMQQEIYLYHLALSKRLNEKIKKSEEKLFKEEI